MNPDKKSESVSSGKMAGILTRREKIAITAGLAVAGAVWFWQSERYVIKPVSVTEIAKVWATDVTSTALERFRLDVGRYPSTAEGLAALLQAPAAATGWGGPYLDRLSLDPWGRDYHYACPGIRSHRPYDIWSLGPDASLSSDDIGNW